VPVVAFPPVTPLTCHVTAFDVVPVTVGVNVCFANVLTVTVGGATVTVTFWFLTVPFGSPLHDAKIGRMAMLSKNSCKWRIEPPVTSSSLKLARTESRLGRALFAGSQKAACTVVQVRGGFRDHADIGCRQERTGFSAHSSRIARGKARFRVSIHCRSVQIPPIGPGTNLDDQRHGQFLDAFHFFAHKFLEFAFFFRWGLEQ
jgi:hypothetical protein